MRNKLKCLMESGADIEFVVNGRKYTVLPWADEGIVIGPQDSDDDMVFSDPDSLIDEYLINGRPLSAWIDALTIEFSG